MSPTNSQRLQNLRNLLKKSGCDGFVLPVTDEYQGEYSPDYARRVTWLTGFDGSAGMLIILSDKAALLVDGRYTLQAAREVDTTLIEVQNSGDITTSRYLKEETVAGMVIGYDPWLHTISQMEALEQALQQQVTFLPLSPNPVDDLWEDQPEKPGEPVFIHDDMLAGMNASEKLQKVIANMAGGIDMLLLSEPDAICWLLNIRGGDIPYNPLPLCYALVDKKGKVQLIIHPDKVAGLPLPAWVDVMDEAGLENLFASLEGYNIGMDASRCPIAFWQRCQNHGIKAEKTANPITLLKSVKNAVEQENIYRAHEVDAQAFAKFLHWFNSLSPEVVVTELRVVEMLENFRREHPDYCGASFATIAGAGEHGAIVHYRATEQTNRTLKHGEALLLDSGGQYPYGTTDITRTLFRGEAPESFRRDFTLVLKGHIALATAIFPAGTTGHQLDILARQYLWQAGKDYQHGTGHGVGHYLCVHEGPQSISTRANGVALQPGMLISNEPGYYKEGEYGIRIESLVLVVEKFVTDGVHYLGFDTVTCVPIDERLVEWSLMNEAETAWLKAYNHDARKVPG